MWLILADERDRSARWVYQGLTRRGLAPIHYLLPEELFDGARIVHRVNSEDTSFLLKLKDNRELRSADIRGVLNRLHCLPHSDFRPGWEQVDAVLAGCLSSLRAPVLPRPSFLDHLPCAGLNHHWVQLADRAGLPVAAQPASDASQCFGIVLHNQFFSVGVPKPLHEGCLRLAALAEMPLLQVEFARREQGIVFHSVSTCPDLRKGGTPLLNSLASTFQWLDNRAMPARAGGPL